MHCPALRPRLRGIGGAHPAGCRVTRRVSTPPRMAIDPPASASSPDPPPPAPRLAQRSAALFAGALSASLLWALADRRSAAWASPRPAPHPAADVAASTSIGSTARSSMAEAPTGVSTTASAGPVLGSGSSAPIAPVGGAKNEAKGDEGLACQLFDAVRPSVVHVSPLRSTQTFSSLDPARLGPGHGCGFLFDAYGHVITAYSTVRGAGEVKVTLYDQSTATARVVGWDPAKELAVLRLALPKHRLEQLQPVALGSSAALRMGERVWVLGSIANGLEACVSQGIVSARSGQVTLGSYAVKNLLLTDAQIGAGCHGGVMINTKGRAVGMSICFGSQAGVLPMDGVAGLAQHIIRHGRMQRPSMGITIAPPGVLQQLGYEEGVLVLDVPVASPASTAGLRPTHRDVFGDIILGDVIITLDTRPIRTAADLASYLDEKRVGDKVRLDVLRDGKRLSMTVTLCERALGVSEE